MEIKASPTRTGPIGGGGGPVAEPAGASEGSEASGHFYPRVSCPRGLSPYVQENHSESTPLHIFLTLEAQHYPVKAVTYAVKTKKVLVFSRL